MQVALSIQIQLELLVDKYELTGANIMNM